MDIKQIIESSGLSDTEIAEGTGLNRSHIWYIRKGKRKPKLETIELIKKYLGK